MKNNQQLFTWAFWVVVVIGANAIAHWLEPNNFWLGLLVAGAVAVVVSFLWRKVVDDKKEEK